MRETLEKFKKNWRKDNVSIKEINDKKYLVLDSELIALYDLIEKGYKLYCMPKNIQKFEIENYVFHEKQTLYKVIECENKYSKEYLIEISEGNHIEIKQDYKCLQLLEIEETNVFKDKLLLDLNNSISELSNVLNEYDDSEFKLILKELIFIFNKLFDKIFECHF